MQDRWLVSIGLIALSVARMLLGLCMAAMNSPFQLLIRGLGIFCFADDVRYVSTDCFTRQRHTSSSHSFAP